MVMTFSKTSERDTNLFIYNIHMYKMGYYIWKNPVYVGNRVQHI